MEKITQYKSRWTTIQVTIEFRDWLNKQKRVKESAENCLLRMLKKVIE